DYYQLDLAERSLFDEHLISAMASHPKVIERSILVSGD
ncbi:arsenate reductase (glutaredoxin), partial [Pseudomonas syringae pv. tagetis]